MNQNQSLIIRAYYLLLNEGVLIFVKQATKYTIVKFSTPFISLFPKYFIYASKFNRLIHTFDTDEYQSPLNPYKIIWVKPKDINKFSRRRWPRELAFGRVKGGDWDIRKKSEYKKSYDRKYWKQFDFGVNKFNESIFYRSLESHFMRDIPWKNTEYYQAAIKAFKKGETVHDGFSSKQELLQDLKNTDILYKNIKENGYHTQTNLVNMRKNNTISFERLRKNEIRVDISRNGELLFVGGGKHRLAISKILDIKLIPVVVMTRHEQWMEHRDYIYKNNLSIHHPDIEYN